MQKKYLLFTFFVCCQEYCFSQDLKNLGLESRWNKGYIILNDGVKRDGAIKNNDKEGIISFRNELDSISQTVRSSQIIVMVYFDLDKGVERRFASLETKDMSTGETDIQLFEIIREFDDFAVLSRQDAVDVIQSKNDRASYSGIGGTTYYGNNSRTVLSQKEVVYFVNKNAERQAYMIIESMDVDGLFDYSKDRGKVLNSHLPAQYFGEEKWNKTKLFLKTRSIKINTKASLLEMLDYYASIKNEK